MNFLADYMYFNSGNEVNENYHLWSAISALSSIVSRKVWVDQGYFRIYANTYVVLLGPPGNGKTTAMSRAKQLVRETGKVPFSAQCQSKENLVKEMMTYQKGVIKPDGMPFVYTPISVFVTELSQFICIDPVRMLDFLVTVYDQDVYDMGTNKHGAQKLDGPYLTLLGCTTTDWVTNYLKADIITGGFTRRALFALEEWSEKRVPRPFVSTEMHQAWDRVQVRANQLTDVFGQFEWEKAGERWFDHWYMTRKISNEPNIMAFDKTMDTQLLKLAMLLQLCKSDALLLTEESLVTALAMLLKLMVNLPAVFSGIGRNELARISAQTLGILTRAGAPVPKKELIQTLWHNANTAEIYQVLNHLVTADKIKFFTKANADGAVKEWVVLGEDAADLLTQAPPVHTPPAETTSDSSASGGQ